MRKKGLSVMLYAAMAALLLTRCGGGGKPTETTAPATTEAMTTADTTAAPGKPEVKTKAEAKGDVASGDLIVVDYAQASAESNWGTADTESFRSTFTEENSHELTSSDAQQRQENQIKAIKNFIQQGADYIVVAPIVETGWGAVLQGAREAGIPVILLDRQMDVDENLYECWVDGNFTRESKTAGDWLAGYLRAQGRDDGDIGIVTLQRTTRASTQVGHTEGFGNIPRQHDDWRMLDIQTGKSTQAEGQKVVGSFLKSYDDVDVMVAEDDDMAFGVINAIKTAGKACGPDGDIVIFSLDTARAAFDVTVAGDLNTALGCNPLHGPHVDEITKKLEKGETIGETQCTDEAYPNTSMDLETIKAERTY